MAYDIGPKIGMDGESEFRKQLNNINTALKTLDTEMKKVTSEFQDNAQGQDALIAKNKVLTKSITEQEKKIEEVKRALAFATSEYGGASNQALKWQQVLNRSEATLNDLTSELRQNEKALQEMETGLRDVETGARKMDAAIDSVDGSKFQQLSKAADGVANKISGISKAAAGLSAAVVALVPTTQEFRRDLSFLEQNAKQVGVGMGAAEKAFKTFNAISGETDSSIEGVSNLLQAGFTESNLQIAVEGLAGAASRFPDTLKIEGLADGLQETLATGEAIGPFAELLDRVGIGADNFSEDLAQCTTEAEKQNLVLETLAKAGLTDSYDAWRKNNKELVDYENAMLDMKGALSDLAVTIAPIITEVAKIGTELLDKFNALPKSIQAVAAVLVLLAAAASPTLSFVGKLGGAMQGLSKSAAAIGPKLAGMGAALSAAAGPILIAVAAIGALIAAFAALWKTNEDFRDNVLALWEQIKTVFSGILEQIKGIITAFVELVNAIWNQFGDEIMAVVGAVINYIVPIITNAMNLIKGIIETVTAIIKGDWSGAWESAKSVVSAAAELIKARVQGAFGALAGIIRSVGGSIGSAVQGAFQSAISYITSLPERALQWGRDFVQGLINGITQKLNALISSVSGLAGKIRSYLHFSRPDVGPLREYEKWMPDFVEGLARGIKMNLPKIETAADMLASTLAIENPVDKIVQTAQMQINNQIDYNKLAGLMNQGIYIEGRQIGRALREAGVVVG